MTRKSIFEMLKDVYNIPQEMNKIVKLFSSGLIYYYTMDDYWRNNTHSLTIEELVDLEILHKWKQRGTCLTCEEIRNAIKFPDTFTAETNIDIIISCLEYYYNLLYLSIDKFNILHHASYKCYTKKLILVKQNMDTLIEHLHYEVHTIEEEEKVILTPKDSAATAVAEISTKNTAMAILQYHHVSLKGNLTEKKSLLRDIANEYEPLLEKPISGFNEYFDKANNMLNNLDIRHNNKDGKHKKENLLGITDSELEKWYDELYQLLLFCVLINDNVKRKKNIEKFLAQVNAKK
ncbi:MAG: hypothetical protein J5594_00965 [Elusimicrobiaceae bacterium]|nr:hypothetical protein [Elusimicrobiaceae bacterium]